MSSSIYNHKHLQPTGASTQGTSQQQHSQARLNDCFDTIRQEFDVLAQELNLLRGQRDDLDNKVTGQVNELNIIRQSLYDLESQHGKIREQYESEIRALRAELHALRSQGREREVVGLASLGRDRPDRPDALRPDPPPPIRGEPSGRDRELLRERELQRDRDRDRERDRDRDITMGPAPGMREPLGRESLGIGRPSVISGPGSGGEGALSALPLTPVALGVGTGPGGGSGNYDFYGRGERGGGDRGMNDRERMSERERLSERERGMSDRERMPDRERAIREGDRERIERDGRDVKRIKTERMKSDRIGDPFSPGLSHPSAHHAHPQSISLGPALPPSSSLPTPGAGPSAPNPNAPPTPLSNGPSTANGPNGSQSANPNSTNGSGNNNGQGPNPNVTPKLSTASGAGVGPMGMALPPPPYPGPQGPGQGQEGPGVNGANPPFPHTPTSSSALPPSLAASNPSALPPTPNSNANSNANAAGEPMQVDLSMDPHNVPPELKKEGPDWFAVFNPGTGLTPTKEGGPSGAGGSVAKKRTLDVSLMHTLMHESVVCCVRFSADGKYLATGCNRTAQIYDTKTGQKTCVLVDEQASKTGDLYIRSVCFSPDGKLLATGAEDKQIRIWDIAKRRIRTVFDGHQQEIYSLDFSRDGRLIVSGSGDKTARIWDMENNTHKILSINEDTVDAGVTSVCISPDGRLVAAGSLDTIVRIWDVQTGVLVERLKGHRDSVYSVAFTPDGKGLVSGSLDKTLKYWDLRPILRGKDANGPNAGAITQGNSSAAKNGAKEGGEKGSQCTMNFTGHKDYVLSVAVSHDGKWVVSGSKDRGVQFWDANTAIAHCMLQGHKNSVISIDLSPAGSILATGSGDWQARIWSYNAL